MKANTTKRFTTTEIVTYSKSNTTRLVSFDTIEEAIAHVEKEYKLHPRSKKFNHYINDTQRPISKFQFNRESAWYLKGLIERNELPKEWR